MRKGGGGVRKIDDIVYGWSLRLIEVEGILHPQHSCHNKENSVVTPLLGNIRFEM